MSEIFYSMVNTTFITTQELIDELQSLKGKTKLKFYQNIYENIMRK